MNSVRPKKHLGQHFLTDRNISAKIVDAIGEPHIKIIEIGPGTGVLTDYLVKEKMDFEAWDVDEESVNFLKHKYPDFAPKFKLQDFLKAPLPNAPLIIMGNFPYNISSQIFFRVIENQNQIPMVVGMIQKEAAERIASKHGNKTYGILSVLIQAYYDVEYLFTVSEKVFNPPPKVKSAVIRLKARKTPYDIRDHKLFFKLVKTAFGQRRKTLRNALKSEFDSQILSADLIGQRAEQLSVEEFVSLSNQYSH